MKRIIPLALLITMFSISSCQPLASSTDYPLAEPGPYHVGLMRLVTYIDETREAREIILTIWYPAQSSNGENNSPIPDATPDLSGAPYPLILSSTKLGMILAPQLATYGFVVAGINGEPNMDTWGDWLIDFPLDRVFTLRQLAAAPPPLLVGVINTDYTGVMGYSFDSFSALALGGARIDPEYYLDQCAQASSKKPAIPQWWIDYICAPAKNWQAFSAHAGTVITSSDEGLWQPITEGRIRAVMPMAPEGAWMFGKDGLAAVDRPILVIAAAEDTINIYDLEASFIYKNLGYSNKGMISFLDRDHMMIFNLEVVNRLEHLATAFFGYHLQGNEEYADYFSRQFVRQHEGLDWGIHR